MCPFTKTEIEKDMLEIPEDLEIDLDLNEENGEENNNNISGQIVNGFNKLNDNLNKGSSETNNEMSGGGIFGINTDTPVGRTMKNVLDILNIFINTTSIKVIEVKEDGESKGKSDNAEEKKTNPLRRIQFFKLLLIG